MTAFNWLPVRQADASPPRCATIANGHLVAVMVDRPATACHYATQGCSGWESSKDLSNALMILSAP